MKPRPNDEPEPNGWSGIMPEGELWEQLKPVAREMRKAPTLAEERLWQKLRKEQLGVKFRRQHAIEHFIVDFYAAQVALVVEIDGPIHDQQVEYDSLRQAFLESLGLRVLRFKNDDVLENIQGVLEVIAEAIDKPLPKHREGNESATYR